MIDFQSCFEPFLNKTDTLMLLCEFFLRTRVHLVVVVTRKTVFKRRDFNGKGEIIKFLIQLIF